MGNVNITQSILNAIDIVVNDHINNADFDKSVKATIIKLVDPTIGEYKVRYENNTFSAYSLNINSAFQEGEIIRLFIPNGNWESRKIILGSVNLTPIEYSSSLNKTNYNLIGPNLITGNYIYGITSNHATLTQIYNANNSEQAQSIGVNSVNLDSYVKNSESNSLVLSAYFKTALLPTQIGGKYGIQFVIEFLDGSQKTIQLNSNSVTGANPYFLTKNTYVEQIIDNIDVKQINRIKTISVYSDKGFPQVNNPNDYIEDIWISNIGINGAKLLTQDESKNYTLYIDYTTNGNKITNSNNNVTFKAILKYNGYKLDNDITYKWYREDYTILDSSSDYYDIDAGRGWALLNNTPLENNSFIFTSQNIQQEGYYSVTAKNTRVKCIAYYNNQVIESKIQQVYFNNGYNLNLISSQQIWNGNITVNKVKYSKGIETEIVYTCQVNNSNNQSLNNLKYYWNINFPDSGSVNSTNQNENSFTFNISENNNIGIIVINCTVYQTQNGNDIFIGTATEKIEIIEGINNSYALTIHNGDRVFQFNENGEFAAGAQSATIEPLTFSLINSQGYQISYEQIINNGQVTWLFPGHDSILSTSTIPDFVYNYTPSSQSDQIAHATDIALSAGIYNLYKNIAQISYSVGSFSPSFVNNTIRLYIKYDNSIIQTYTVFSIVKDGDPGSNGTDTIARTVSCNTNNTNIKSTQRLYLKSDGSTNDINIKSKYIDDLTEQAGFGFQLQRNNILVKDITNHNNLSWIIPLKNNQTSYFQLGSTSTYYSLVKKSGINLPKSISEVKTSISSDNIVNILRGIYTADNLVYYSEMPVCYVYTTGVDNINKYKIRVKEGTGFSWVTYDQAGRNPQYNFGGNSTFTIEYYQNEELIDSNLSYQWWQVGNGFTTLDTYLDNDIETVYPLTNLKSILNLNNYPAIGNSLTIIPSDDFNSSDLTSAIVVNIYNNSNNQNIGFIYIPIYKLINRYSHKYFNSWDGNSIQLDADNSRVILAPQIVAGKKENNNSFTGITIGQIQSINTGQNDTNNITGANGEVGLFAYNKGERTAFLDSTDGSVTFGKYGSGQIKITTSNNGNAQGIIQSGIYTNSNNQINGMKIKFSNTNIDGQGSGPFIKFGDGTGYFIADSNQGIKVSGNITAIGAVSHTNQGYLTQQASSIGGLSVYQDTSNNVPIENITSAGMGKIHVQSSQLNSAFGDGTTNEDQNLIFWGGTSLQDNSGLQFGVSQKGQIFSRSGVIGGWKIGTNCLESKGNVNNGYVKLIGQNNQNGITQVTNYAIEIGEGNTRKFSVTHKGILYAKSADIEGKITAKEGTIGGWNINTNSISTYTPSNYPNRKVILRASSSYQIKVFQVDDDNGQAFSVSSYGQLYARKGTIAGWQINNGYLSSNCTGGYFQINTSNSSGKSNYFLWGGTDSSTEIFSVRKNGILHATNADISGKITATSGQIGPWTVEDTAPYNLHANHNSGSIGLGSFLVKKETINSIFNLNLKSDVRFRLWGTSTSSGITDTDQGINFGVGVSGTVYAKNAKLISATIKNATITNASIDTASIPDLDASKIKSGYLSANRINSNTISVAKLTGTIKDDATKPTWEINLKTGKMTVGQISASKITTGTLNADRISAGTLSLSKLKNSEGTSSTTWETIKYVTSVKAFRYTNTQIEIKYGLRSIKVLAAKNSTGQGDSSSIATKH